MFYFAYNIICLIMLELGLWSQPMIYILRFVCHDPMLQAMIFLTASSEQHLCSKLVSIELYLAGHQPLG